MAVRLSTVFTLALLMLTTASSAAAPETNRLRVAGNQIEMTGAPGFLYQLQQSTVLLPAPAWQNNGAALTVAAPGPVSWTFSATNSQSFFRVEITSTGPTISPTEARVITEVIRPADQTNLVLGLRWPVSLPAGAIVEPISNSDENPQQWVVDAPSDLFVIDHAPSQKLAHPFTYVLVEIASGNIRLIDSFYPPVVDGVSHLTTFADRWSAAARFFPTNFANVPPLASSISLDIPNLGDTNIPFSASSSPLTAQADAGTNGTSTAHSTVNCTNVVRKKVAVVIASGADDEIQNDAREMSALLTRLGFTVTDFNSVSNTTTQIQNGIVQAGQGLGPCDKFFVYLSSHTQLVDDNDDGKPDGLPIRLDFGMGHTNATKWDWLPTRNNNFTAALQAVPAGQLNLMLDTCFSEAFALLMRRHKGQVPTGATWNIFASSSSTNTSGGASTLDLLLDYNNDDVNSVYTTKILDKVIAAADANQIDTNGDGELSIEEIEQAFNNAHTAAANELSTGQQPKFDQFKGPVPIAAADTFVVPPGQSITNKIALNDTVVPGTRFVLVDPPSIHADLYSWNPQTGEMTLTGLTTITETSFRYKLVAGPYETDPISVTIRFDARMNYDHQFLATTNNTVRVPCIILDGLYYPIYQFRLANNPADLCQNPHWHAHGTVFPIDVLVSPGRNDPNPGSCGFGKVKEVQAGFFEVSNDVWQDFLIDHIPPIN